MDCLAIGDEVENSVQRATVRWLGDIENIPIIGLQVINSNLPGYTDGTCPYNNERYFTCTNGQGYYILKSTFNDSYKLHQKQKGTSNSTTFVNASNSSEESRSASPMNIPISLCPIRSYSLPSVSQIQDNADSDQIMSSSRGFLKRIILEREQRNSQMNSSSEGNQNPLTSALATQSDPALVQKYHPESDESISDGQPDKITFDTHNSNDDYVTNVTNCLSFQRTNNNDVPSPNTSSSLRLFGSEYFLNNWTLRRVKSLLTNEISALNQLCLHIFEDQRYVQNLIDQQIHITGYRMPTPIPNNICIELTKLFDNVKIIFPSRALRLYNNDYLLLAILCSNNQCAYVRTSDGWAYTDDDSDYGHPIVVEEISEMIDSLNINTYDNSEQCLYVLKNACLLYYKLVE